MNRSLTRLALRLLEERVPFARATVVRAVGSVPGKLGASMIVTSTGDCFGTVGGAALEERVKAAAAGALEARRGDLLHFDLRAWSPGGLPSLCGGSVDIAVEYVPARPNLLLWGGGHVAHAFALLLPGLEFDHSVADDRPEWVTLERFPAAERREVVEPARLWDRFEPGRFSHLYLLGYDAKKDTEVLAASLGRFPGHLGLIASKPKRTRVFAELRRRGFPAAAIARIRSPIGVSISAESPAEIAVSIAAEVIQDLHSAPELPPESPRRELAEEHAAHHA